MYIMEPSDRSSGDRLEKQREIFTNGEANLTAPLPEKVGLGMSQMCWMWP